MLQTMADIKSELDRIKIRISDVNFLANKGLSNEVGIHVFPYEPKDELVVRDFIQRLVAEPSEVYHVIERDLYDIFMEILTEKRILHSIPGLEEKKGKDFLLANLQNIAKPQAFLEKMEYTPHECGKDVLFLTGIGKVYPFMRSHIMLNAMQEMFADIPVVMFYPGKFNGQNLILFNQIFDSNYYRAFNLL